MGIRKDFEAHKRKTIESFGYVAADISGINSHMGQLKSIISSFESKISAVENEMRSLRQAVDSSTSAIGRQQNDFLAVQSKVEDMGKSISNSTAAINSLGAGVKSMASRQQDAIKKISSHDSSISKLFELSKLQPAKEKKFNSHIKSSQEEIRKTRRIIDEKIRAVNSKITGKGLYMPGKPSKIKVRKRTSQGRTIITVNAPGKTLVKAVTPSKKRMVGAIRQGRRALI